MTSVRGLIRSANAEVGVRIGAVSGRTARRPFPRISIAVEVIAWFWLALATGMAALIWLAADRWWPATLFAFGPRWLILLPLPILLPLAVHSRRRTGLALAVGAALAVGPVMGYCVSWHSLAFGTPPDDDRVIRFMTCNCGEGGNDSNRLGELLTIHRPQVVTLNEWNRGGPAPTCFGAGWHVAQHGTVLLAARFPILRTELLRSSRLESWHVPATRFDLDTPWGIIHVVGVHLETPREGIEALMASGWRDPAEMKHTTEIRRVESELSSRFAAELGGPTIVAGDFNMPVESTIYRRDWSSRQNAFSTVGFGFGYTKFMRRFGVRIDHVLVDENWRIVEARVESSLGGDHRPLLTHLELKNGPRELK